jgi:hypothetical protein
MVFQKIFKSNNFLITKLVKGYRKVEKVSRKQIFNQNNY